MKKLLNLNKYSYLDYKNNKNIDPLKTKERPEDYIFKFKMRSDNNYGTKTIYTYIGCENSFRACYPNSIIISKNLNITL